MIRNKFKKSTETKTEFASGAEARAHFILKGYTTVSSEDKQVLMRKNDGSHEVKIVRKDFLQWVVEV